MFHFTPQCVRIIGRNRVQKESDDCTIIVGSPAYSLFFCANAVDERNVHNRAANCEMRAGYLTADVAGNRGVYHCWLQATRDIEPGEELILDSYNHESKAKRHRFDVHGIVIEEAKGKDGAKGTGTRRFLLRSHIL